MKAAPTGGSATHHRLAGGRARGPARIGRPKSVVLLGPLPDPASERASARAPSGSARPAPARRERASERASAAMARRPPWPRCTDATAESAGRNLPGPGGGGLGRDRPSSAHLAPALPGALAQSSPGLLGRPPPGPPGAAGSPRAVVSRAPRRRKSAGGGAAAPPCPWAGALHSVRWAAGRAGAAARAGAAGTGGARTRARAPGGEAYAASPARPSPGPRAGARGCAPRRAKAKAALRAAGPSNFAAGGADEELRGAALGDGERAGRVGSGARARCFPGYK